MTSSIRSWGNYLLGVLAGAGVATLVLLYIDPPAPDQTGLGQARAFTQQTIGMALLLAGIIGLNIGRKKRRHEYLRRKRANMKSSHNDRETLMTNISTPPPK